MPEDKKPSARKRSTLSRAQIKLSAETRRLIARNAKRYAKGNFSAWMRDAARRYVPRKGQKISFDA